MTTQKLQYINLFLDIRVVKNTSHSFLGFHFFFFFCHEALRLSFIVENSTKLLCSRTCKLAWRESRSNLLIICWTEVISLQYPAVSEWTKLFWSEINNSFLRNQCFPLRVRTHYGQWRHWHIFKEINTSYKW